jgi:hypothetical protein
VPAANPFRQIIRHVQETVQAEQALGNPHLVERLRTEERFFFDHETPTALTTARSLRLHKLHELVREVQTFVGINVLLEVQPALDNLYAVMWHWMQRCAKCGGIDHQDKIGRMMIDVQTSLQPLYAFAAAVSGSVEAADAEGLDAFIPAKDCRGVGITTHRQLIALLREVPDDAQGIRRRYRGQHLFIHGGGWHRWRAAEERREFDATDRAVPTVEEAIARAKAKAGQDGRKRKEGRALPGLLPAADDETP